LRRKIICPICGEYGRLEIQKDDKYRINHDIMSKGLKKPARCYLGSLEKALKNLTSVSEVRDDLLNPDLLAEIKSSIKNDRKEHVKKIHDSEYGTLITRIIELSKNFGTWKSDRHKLTKQASCPHCTKRIQYEFVRVGPFRSVKKNIESFSIGKGSVYKTSPMREN